MIKLIQVFYINLLGFLDFNKNDVAKKDGVQASSANKIVLTAIIAIIYGYLIYNLIINIGSKLSDKYLIIEISYLASFFICFLLDIFYIESMCFKSNDNDLLFSLPLSKTQIILSKLFNVYLRNLFFVIVIMLSGTLGFASIAGTILEEVVLMIIISSLLVPIIPIIIGTLISFFSGYLKIKLENRFVYSFVKGIIFLIIIGILFIYIVGFDMKINNINGVLFRIEWLCPLVFLFTNAVKMSNIFSFFLLVILSCFALYIYTFIISDNYSKICSILKGVKTNKIFVYKKSYNFGKLFGFIKKELIYIFSNKTYLLNSFGNGLLFSVILFIFCLFFSIDKYLKNELILVYFNMFFPMFMSILSSVNISTINSISLEQKRIEYLRTLPINMALILFSKWFANIMLGSVFVIINGIIVWLFWDLSNYMVVMSFIMPFVALMFTSFTSLLLDLIFPMKDEMNENVIIKGRLLSFVPMFLSLLIGISPVFLVVVNLKYKFFQIGYVVILLTTILIEIMYMFIFRKKLIKKLFI